MTSAHGLFSRLPSLAAFTLAWFFAEGVPASAQAWVPPGGVGGVSILYQNVQHTGHLLTDGSLLEGFDSASQGLLIQFDYALTDKLSVTAGIPYIGAKYTGPLPSFFGLGVDECFCWKHSWQDFGATLRYNIANDAFALTPSVSFGVPSHNYNSFGEAVVGTNLYETRLGVDVGQRLDAISPRLAVSGRYSYAFVEQVLDMGIDRSNATGSASYLFTQRLSASVDFYWQHTHGGLTSDDFFAGVSPEVFAQFDRLLKDSSFQMGGSVAYSFSRFDLFANYIEFVDGVDTHTGRAFTLGIHYPFQIF